MKDKNTNKRRVFAIDPGTTTCGWSLLEYNIDDGNVVVLKTGIISSRKVVVRAAMRDKVAIFGKTILVLEILRKKLFECLSSAKPDYVVIEDAFFNPKRPSAYAILLQCIVTVRRLIYTEYNMPLYTVPTRTAKQTMTGNGGDKKQCVQDMIISKEDIIFKNDKLKYSIIVDEADSIAVGYHFCKKVLPTLLLDKADATTPLS